MKILFILTLILLGCNSSDSIFDNDDYISPNVDTDYDLNDEGEQVLIEPKSIEFSCTSQDSMTSNCPSYLAHIQVRGRGACTGVLISPSEILTTNECTRLIDDEDCQDEVTIYLPSKTKRPYIRKCSSILSGTHALIQLDHSVKREEVEFSRAGVKDLQDVHVYTTSFHLSENLIQVHKERCVNAKNTILNEGDISSYSEDLVLRNCDLARGHSGSPLVLENGLFVGMVEEVQKVDYQYFGPLEKPDYNPFDYTGDPLNFRSYKGKRGFVDDTLKVAMGMSSLCMSIENTNIKLDSLCESEERVSFDVNTSKEIYNSIQTQIDDKAIAWNISLNDLIPVCVKSPESLMNSILKEQWRIKTFFKGIVHYYSSNVMSLPVKVFTNNFLKKEAMVLYPHHTKDYNSRSWFRGSRYKDENDYHKPKEIKLNLTDYKETGEVEMSYSLFGDKIKKFSLPSCKVYKSTLN